MPTVTSLNAVDFGMTTGGGDQTANFQAAINAAQNQQLPLYIPDGSYSINTVKITKPVVIYSNAGSASLRSWNNISPCIKIAPAVAGTRFGPVQISDISMAGQSKPLTGGLIQASEIDKLTIERCTLQGSGDGGISLSQTTGWISNNSINGILGVGIFSIDGGVIIDGNRLQSLGNGGILVFRSAIQADKSIISNNTITGTTATSGGSGQYGNAINVFRANMVSVINNKIAGSAFSAIRLNSASDCQVIGNQTTNCNENAIYLEAPGSGDTYQGGIVANNIIDTCGTGISIANTNNGGRRVVVTGNQIRHVTDNTVTVLPSGPNYHTWGHGISAGGDTLVSNNIIEDTASWGIVLDASDYDGVGTIKVIGQGENNMLKNCAGGIVFVKEWANSRLFIGGNTIYNYTTTTKYAALVPGTFLGGTGEYIKLPGATDLGNATSSGFANVQLLLNYAFL